MGILDLDSRRSQRHQAGRKRKDPEIDFFFIK